MPHLVVVGGGSAGHVIPAVPVIQALVDDDWRITFIGTTSGLEQELIKDLPVRFKGIAAGKLRRYWSWKNLTDLFRIALGVLQSLVLLITDRPQVVFSKGGFVSFPVALSAWLLRIPVVAHESDLTPGLANRLVLPFIRCLCTSFEATKVEKRGVRVVHTGTPIRDVLLDGDAKLGRQQLGLDADQKLLVVTGGSLGADFLNQVVRQTLSQLTQDFFVFHVCGAGKILDTTADNYQQVEYVAQGWGDILAAADIVISRAGANALFELLALGKLNLLVPLSAKASRGDQIENAAFSKQQGYSVVCKEEALTPEALMAGLQNLDANKASFVAALAKFRHPDSVSRIREEIVRFAS
ncbi:MAG: UDP-N-acetylglucosamine--N-acetylmuramyl-(pentapeptide) pyrophosphoryl-undecaprenol N-acetylglucosamine transferase [Pseudomonadota bacterium]